LLKPGNQLAAFRRGTVAQVAMWGSVALLAYGIFFAVEGHQWISEQLDELVVQPDCCNGSPA
jgi:hypothetical protein